MNGETGDVDRKDDDDAGLDEFPEDTVVLSSDIIDDDDINDTSAELDVSQLVAKLDSDSEAPRKREIHRRLEEIQDRRETEKNIDSTYNFNLDEDL